MISYFLNMQNYSYYTAILFTVFPSSAYLLATIQGGYSVSGTLRSYACELYRRRRARRKNISLGPDD